MYQLAATLRSQPFPTRAQLRCLCLARRIVFVVLLGPCAPGPTPNPEPQVGAAVSGGRAGSPCLDGRPSAQRPSPGSAAGTGAGSRDLLGGRRGGGGHRGKSQGLGWVRGMLHQHPKALSYSPQVNSEIPRRRPEQKLAKGGQCAQKPPLNNNTAACFKCWIARREKWKPMR